MQKQVILDNKNNYISAQHTHNISNEKILKLKPQQIYSSMFNVHVFNTKVQLHLNCWVD